MIARAHVFVGARPFAGTRCAVLKHRRVAVVSNALVLKPIGDGNSEHLGGGFKQTGSISLSSGLFEIGRQEPADIIIPVPSVSGRHAMLRVDDERVTVTDLRSTNGTYLDGTEITPMQAYEVMPGNTIIFGDEHLAMFLLEQVADAPASDAAPASPATAADEPKESSA